MVPARPLSLGWGVWLELEGVSGTEVNGTTGICPSQQGWDVVGALVHPVRRCWGSGHPPKLSLFGLM